MSDAPVIYLQLMPLEKSLIRNLLAHVRGFLQRLSSRPLCRLIQFYAEASHSQLFSPSSLFPLRILIERGRKIYMSQVVKISLRIGPLETNRIFVCISPAELVTRSLATL